MSLRKLYTFLFLSLALYSCDCAQRAQGIIIDSDTRGVISNVSVSRNKEDAECISDSKGHFNFEKISGTPNFELYFSKKGYKDISKRYKGISHSTDTILLVASDKTL
jgi:hypothetical protein